MDVHIARSDEQIDACFPVMAQLRPSLRPEEFVSRIRKQERTGYRLAFIEEEGRPVAVAGYRVSHKLSSGSFLFVDDLVTDASFRSRGYGSRLLGWLREQARAVGCASVQLDTGVQRKDAHRFYEREGMRLSAFRYEI